MGMIMREIEIDYKGESYDISMNMGLINKIESAGVNILSLQICLDEGGIPPLSLLSTMFAICLSSTGKRVTPDDVWAYITSGGDGTAKAVAACRVLLASMFIDTGTKDAKK